MQFKSFLKKSSFIFIILAGVLLGVAVYAGVNKILPEQSIDVSNTSFSKNASGETYGSARDVSPNERNPDLIEAMAANGEIGYVRANDLNGKEPKSIEEALAQNGKRREINVYKSDGKTIIGKFKIGSSISEVKDKGETSSIFK